MTIAQNPQKINPARAAFRGSRAHPYVVQMALNEKPRHQAVRSDCYLVIVENGHRTPLLLETHPKGIKVIVDYKREQVFTINALSQSDRILAHLGLEDDDNRAFERMCAAFAQAHGVDPDFEAAAQRKIQDKQERKSRSQDLRERFGQAPGDGGVKPEDFDGGPTPEYQRILAQEMARRERIERQPANIGEEIQTLLGQEPGSGQAHHQVTEAERERGYKYALGNHQPKKSIGSIPAEWQF